MYRVLAFALFCFWGLAQAKLVDQLELLANVNPGDSVISITQTGAQTLSVLVQQGNQGQPRTLELSATPAILAKLKSGAEAESIPWIMNEFQPETANPTSTSPSSAGPVNADGMKTGIDSETKNQGEKADPELKSTLRKNKFKYVSTQTVFSTYTYGFALPIALEAPEKAGALTLLAFPISFGSHYYFAWNRDYYDSHLFATSYFGANALLLSYVLPFLVMGPDFNAFRVGSFAALAAYPFGLNYGYKHGTRFQDEPGRVSLQSTYAVTMGIMGYVGVALWAEGIESAEVGLRIGVAQVVGAAVGGHYLSYRYRTHEKIPGGIGPGIGSWALLGGMTSVSLLTSVQPENPQLIGAILLAGIGGGFFGGQRFLYDQYDTYERAGYNSLGMTAGAVTPLGFMLLAGSDFEEPSVVLWSLTAGAAAGYAITRHFTSSMVENPRRISSQQGLIKSFAIQPIPVPIPEKVNGKVSLKISVPVLSATF